MSEFKNQIKEIFYPEKIIKYFTTVDATVPYLCKHVLAKCFATGK